MKAKIFQINDIGWTYEVLAQIGTFNVTFYTTHPSDEELQFHCQKQYEMVERARAIAEQYKEKYKELIGKEYDVQASSNARGDLGGDSLIPKV